MCRNYPYLTTFGYSNYNGLSWHVFGSFRVTHAFISFALFDYLHSIVCFEGITCPDRDTNWEGNLVFSRSIYVVRCIKENQTLQWGKCHPLSVLLKKAHKITYIRSCLHYWVCNTKVLLLYLLDCSERYTDKQVVVTTRYTVPTVL